LSYSRGEFRVGSTYGESSYCLIQLPMSMWRVGMTSLCGELVLWRVACRPTICYVTR